MAAGWVHEYVSTACLHAINDGYPELHKACRNTCKTCDRPCGCWCHAEAGTQPYATTWVDQARDIARELLADLAAAVGIAFYDGELANRIATDPELFWLRGEEREPGTWTPPAEGPQS